MQTQRIQQDLSVENAVVGGVRIAGAAGATTLIDYMTGLTSGQLLIDQAWAATATLYIPLYPSYTKAFWLDKIYLAYWDTANLNDLARVYLYTGAAAGDYLQGSYLVWWNSVTSPIVETNQATTPILQAPDHPDAPIPVYLQTAGRLYFQTDWTTAVIDCDAAAEYFIMYVVGRAMDATDVVDTN